MEVFGTVVAGEAGNAAVSSNEIKLERRKKGLETKRDLAYSNILPSDFCRSKHVSPVHQGFIFIKFTPTCTCYASRSRSASPPHIRLRFINAGRNRCIFTIGAECKSRRARRVVRRRIYGEEKVVCAGIFPIQIIGIQTAVRHGLGFAVFDIGNVGLPIGNHFIIDRRGSRLRDTPVGEHTDNVAVCAPCLPIDALVAIAAHNNGLGTICCFSDRHGSIVVRLKAKPDHGVEFSCRILHYVQFLSAGSQGRKGKNRYQYISHFIHTIRLHPSPDFPDQCRSICPPFGRPSQAYRKGPQNRTVFHIVSTAKPSHKPTHHIRRIF